MKPVICQRPATCIDLTMGSEKKGSVVTTWKLAMNERLICPAFIVPHLFLHQYFSFVFFPLNNLHRYTNTGQHDGVSLWAWCRWLPLKSKKRKERSQMTGGTASSFFSLPFLGWSTAVSFKKQWEQQSHIKTGLLTLPRLYEPSFLQCGAVRRPAAQRNLETLLWETYSETKQWAM